MKLGKLFEGLAQVSGPEAETDITHMTLDSREVSEGHLFCALKGLKHDGHDHLSEVLSLGTAAVAVERQPETALELPVVIDSHLQAHLPVLASRFFSSPSKQLHLIGVTGTNGKSSVSDFIRQLLKQPDYPSASIGTLGVQTGDRIRPLMHTTPDVITLNTVLRDLVEEGCQAVAMEVSSHALVQGRVEGLAFNTAIFTNLSQDHLDFHQTMGDYSLAKSRLFRFEGLELAIVNLDDPASVDMLRDTPSALRILHYSMENPKADVSFRNILHKPTGYALELDYCGQRVSFATQLSGHFNLYNLLAAMIAVKEMGYDIEAVAQAAENLLPVAGRMQTVPNPFGAKIFVDFAHTPDALENVLRAARTQLTERLLLVFGCGGDRDSEKRPLMGQVASACADFTWITSDNPRSESPAAICDDIAAGFTGNGCEVIVDRYAAIAAAVDDLTANDVLVVAGKGHEKTQTIGDRVLPFDDVAVLEEIFSLKEKAL